MQQTQVLSSIILPPSARSTAPSIAIPSTAPFFDLTLAVGRVAPAELYQCEVRSAARKAVATVPVAKLESDSNLTLLIPTNGFAAGYYEAVLVGVSSGTATELDRYPFAVTMLAATN